MQILYKIKRLRWLGHVLRRNYSKMISIILNWKPNKRRPLGRPRLRWEDQVGKGLERTRIKGVAEEGQEERRIAARPDIS